MTQRDRALIVTNIFTAATFVATDAIIYLVIFSLVWMALLLIAEFSGR